MAGGYVLQIHRGFQNLYSNLFNFHNRSQKTNLFRPTSHSTLRESAAANGRRVTRLYWRGIIC